MKAIVESVEWCRILVTQAKVSLQTAGLATRLFNIKDQYECLSHFIKTMDSVK